MYSSVNFTQKLDILKPEMAFFVFILGLIIGSFLNVLIDRIPRGEKLGGRSHCENCHKELNAVDLVPLLSFVWLRGKCRYCHSRLSIQYPLVELLTGVLFTFAYLSFDLRLVPFALFIISVLIVVFFTDLKYGIIPDKIIFPAIGITFVYLVFSDYTSVLNHLISATGAFVFFYVLYLVTKRRGIGFGDVKFAFLIGLIFGFPATFFALYIAFLTGGALGLILILWKKKRLKTTIPFGPFLVFGSLAILFWIEDIKRFAQTFF